MTDGGRVYDYPDTVGVQIQDAEIADYARAADFLNHGRFDVISLQHEFGIFGGAAGQHVTRLLERLNAPVVTTLHTILEAPSPAQRRAMESVIDQSARVVVMAAKGRELLREVYLTPDSKIEIIPHGVPDVAFAEPDQAKADLGFEGRSVLLTFGLLSPNKGIEVMIDAMPDILSGCPNVVYVVLGATHPNLIREQGEAYRQSLIARAKALGVEQQVVFHDRFVDQATLLRYIAMCDVYVTPYLNEKQMTSGTLAYSFGLGKAVVSTPYWHAQDLLADGRGLLAPFGDSKAIGAAISGLLSDPARRDAMRLRAYETSRSMTWRRVAERYLSVFDGLGRGQRLRVITRPESAAAVDPITIAPRTDHFLAMCDDTGMFQHALRCVPDRAHGYCTDDNARALLLACALDAPGEAPLPDTVSVRFASFLQHAWNPHLRRFRNFMSFDRRWLEEAGSEDSHGRALWALGEAARSSAGESRRRWAADLFEQAQTPVEAFTSPRAWAFALLGLDGYCAAHPEAGEARRLRLVLADRLLGLLMTVEGHDWVWFEEGLSYDNARLPQALLVTAAATGRAAYSEAGLRSLRWLSVQQTNAAGQFRPVGTASFGEQRVRPRPFDQQPVEAAATIAACLAACRLSPDAEWRTIASKAFAWFMGANDLSAPLAVPETGGCRDGLHPDRANENQGAESVLSYLLGLCEMRLMHRLSDARTKFAPRIA